jgi:hypothetical protein
MDYMENNGAAYIEVTTDLSHSSLLGVIFVVMDMPVWGNYALTIMEVGFIKQFYVGGKLM